jgi:DNA-binding LacI/PurR family transcriptional regulator
MLVGVIVREITDPFFAGAVEAISLEARTRGYNVVLGNARARTHEAVGLRAVLETRHVDAILLLGDASDQPRLVRDLRETRVPVVVLWQGSGLPGIASVNVDNRAGINAAIDHLMELGHRDIAFIAGRPVGDIQERRAAFLDYVARRRNKPPDAYLQPASNDPADAARVMANLVNLPARPTAVIASTDVQAIGALHGAFQCGLCVPDDISVVGFDDIPLAAYMVPPLTTVHMPVTEMAAVAVRLALDKAAGDDSDRLGAEVLPPSLVIRGSSGPARSG